MISVLTHTVFGILMINYVSGVFEIGKNHSHTNCKHYENEFKNGLQKFYSCSLGNTLKDFWLCTNCSETFTNMSSNYEMLKTTYDPVGNVSCISELINNDRLNYWHRIHEEAMKLWDDAHCYKCYNWNGTIIEHQEYSDDFITFMNLTSQLEGCENVNKNKTCDKCNPNYKELNKFYERIKKNYKNNICFDIENSMNKTRRHWSGDLGCCRDDEASFLVFSILASVIGALPIAFYFCTYFATKRSEDHSPVTDAMITPTVPSINNLEAMPGTSNGESSPLPRIHNNIDVKKSNIHVNPKNFNQSQTNQNLIDLDHSLGIQSITQNVL